MMRKLLAGILFVLTVHSSCALPGYAADKDIALPGPKPVIGVDLMQALMQRMSIRSFAGGKLPLDAVAAVLWAGYGMNRPNGKRTVPSAHGNDVIDLYAALDTGVYRYDPQKHMLRFISSENIKGRIAAQSFVAQASMVVIIVGKPNELSGGSAGDRSAYVSFTAGAASENMYLAAGALGLGTVVMAQAKKDELRRELRLPGGHVPLYIMPVGYRR